MLGKQVMLYSHSILVNCSLSIWTSLLSCMHAQADFTPCIGSAPLLVWSSLHFLPWRSLHFLPRNIALCLQTAENQRCPLTNIGKYYVFHISGIQHSWFGRTLHLVLLFAYSNMMIFWKYSLLLIILIIIIFIISLDLSMFIYKKYHFYAIKQNNLPAVD